MLRERVVATAALIDNMRYDKEVNGPPEISEVFFEDANQDGQADGIDE